MAKSKLNEKIVEALKNCETEEELAKLAKENRLTDDELAKVRGGAGPIEKEKVGEPWLYQLDDNNLL